MNEEHSKPYIDAIHVAKQVCAIHYHGFPHSKLVHLIGLVVKHTTRTGLFKVLYIVNLANAFRSTNTLKNHTPTMLIPYNY